MGKKKLGGIIAAVVLTIAVIISVGIVAAGEEIQSQSNETMEMSDDMMALLKKLEGFNPHAYWDYSQTSIGYGTVCPIGYEKYYAPITEGGEGHTITEEQAETLLWMELEKHEARVNNFIARYNLKLSQHQYDALVSYTYNTGCSWTESKAASMIASVLDTKDGGSDIAYGMLLYSKAGGVNGQHILVNRRTIETYVYATGNYPEYPYGRADLASMKESIRLAHMDGNGGAVNYSEHGFYTKDPTSIKAEITSAPTGPDENGAAVTYVFDGWYTEREGGRKVEVLDESIPYGATLYAHWKTPSGTPVTPPLAKPSLKISVTVTSSADMRFGPETYYGVIRRASAGEVLEIDEIRYYEKQWWGRADDAWIELKNTNYNSVSSSKFPVWGKVIADSLNVRSEANTSSAIVSGAAKVKDDFVLITEWKADTEHKIARPDRAIMWGKIEEGWIALPYVTFEGVGSPAETVKSIQISSKPSKLIYVHKAEALDVTGGKLLVTYGDNSTTTVDITSDMISGFDNTTVGANKITITYEGVSTTLEVEIVKAKVVFKMDDGTVISNKEYLYGDTIEIPEQPTKPADSDGYYVFIGWGREVDTTCIGNAEYTAVFEKKNLPGDTNCDGKVNDRDVLYLLDHVLFPTKYELYGTGDMNGDSKVNDRDVLYLLDHVLFPSKYPLKN